MPLQSMVVATGDGTFQNLNAVTATGAGAAIDLGVTRTKFTMQTTVTGAPTAVSVTLQGSLDGVNWSTLATSTSTTGDQQYAIDRPVRFVRTNLGTLTGGTSPTVTTFIAASN